MVCRKKSRHTGEEIIMGAPSPELVDLWLARAFNARDVEAAAAMYHPDASVVRLEQVHGMEVMRRLPNGEWVFFIDHPWGADPSWAVARPPRTE